MEENFMTELPIAPVKRIIKNTGISRVSEDASEALAVCLEEIAEEIAGKAHELARHAGRKTIKASDILLATEQ